MDFLSNLKGDKDKDQEKSRPTSEDHEDDPEKKKPSRGDIFHSAKVVADAIHGPPENRDKAKLAGATADLLAAAGDYGLDEKGYGKYLDKAEEMLRKQAGKKGPEDDEATEDEKTSGKKHGGGYGDVLNMAHGFFDKKSDGGKEEDEKKGRRHHEEQ